MLNIIIKFLRGLEIVCYLLIGISILNFILDIKPPEFINMSNDIKLPLILIVALTMLGNVYLLSGFFRPLKFDRVGQEKVNSQKLVSGMLWFGSSFSIIGTILWGLGFSKSDYRLALLLGIVLAIGCLSLIVLNKLKPISLFALLGRAIPSLVVAVLLLVFE